MNPNTILGVLTDTHFILIGTVGGKRAPQSIPLPPQVSDRSTLFRHAVQAGLTSLWVMPGTRFSREVSRFFIEQTDNVRKPGARHHPQRSKTSLHCVPEQGDAGHQVFSRRKPGA